MDEGETIEKESFRIIEEKLGGMPSQEREVATRVVHATADLSFAGLLEFHCSIAQALNLLAEKPMVITDVNMVKAGIRNSPLIGAKECYIASREVKDYAKEHGITRARAAFRSMAEKIEGSLVAIGNSPTALLELVELIDRGVKPGFVVASPVGFVSAKESKEEVLKRDVPAIVVRGPRGGSNVAAAIANALIIMAEREKIH